MSENIGSRAIAPSILVVTLALLPFGLGYFLSYLFRAANAIVASNLVSDVGLSAGDLGVLTAVYLLAFACFQLPLGILLDRHGPRRVQSVLVGVAALGALLFAYGQDAATLMIARMLIGIGSAGGLMSSFKAVVLWVPEPRRPLANSLVMSAGALGLLTASTPLELAVQWIGWRMTFVAMGGVAAMVAAMIFLVVPERGATAAPLPLRQQLALIAGIYRDRVFLTLLPVLVTTAGAQIAIQTLWVGPWFRDVAGLDRMGVANHLFVMAAAFFAGILLTGLIADWAMRRGISILSVMLACIFLYLGSTAWIVFGPGGGELFAWIIFSMTGQVSVLAFPWLSSYFGAALSGRANTAANLPMFLLAFVFQALIGWVIDLYPLATNGGYAPAAYRMAFGLLLAIEGLSLLWFLANRRVVTSAEDKIRNGLAGR